MGSRAATLYRLTRITAWTYILAYETVRAFYVLILMPLAGGTFGSIVGWMILAFILLVFATVQLVRRFPVALTLLLVYLLSMSAIWFFYEQPVWTAFLRDRILDLLLLPAFFGAGRERMYRNDVAITS